MRQVDGGDQLFPPLSQFDEVDRAIDHDDYYGKNEGASH
jgi:hypothetical protein